MTRAVISPEEGAELQQPRLDHAAAVERTGAILAAKGMDSLEFAEADRAAGAISRRIREILGDSGKHWMS
jgi:hypothetical protein